MPNCVGKYYLGVLQKKEIVLQININLGVGAYMYFVILGMFVILYIYCLNDVEKFIEIVFNDDTLVTEGLMEGKRFWCR